MGEIALFTKAVRLAKSITTSKWLYLILAMLAIGGGLYLYLDHVQNKAVEVAVKNNDQNSTNKTLQTNDAVNKATAAKETKFVILHDQTVKDYTNARAALQAAPVADRNAQAPSVIIDTLNDLDRLRSARDDAAPVSDANLPSG